MITICPSCDRQFRIYAAQLSAAKGLVQCGFCGKQFNALDRLHDQPLPHSDSLISEDEHVKESGQQGPQFEIPVTSIEVAKEPVSNLLPVHRSADAAATITDVGLDADSAEELIFSMLENKPVKSSRIGTVLWSLGAISLVIIVAAQFLWFNRDELLARYPQYLPAAKILCERLHCQLTREQDMTPIVVVNRDVRDHPGYLDVLLVNVTIENQSEQVLPYPQIQLSLFDTNGNISGYRRFTPSEYLAENINREMGIRPMIPVHLVLEVAGSTENAVSFEINFL